ncbi:amino acid adenylation domain-containing protein [Nocardia brevicatena]|uniref:amino acid adenylation domain-containing protein n=1 Tax=Nocardia brevicatena TaxID=37327 RepID=UPI000684CD8B|nr:amino acid adenylation domain-containing protein [Nocardia brevicatena]
MTATRRPARRAPHSRSRHPLLTQLLGAAVDTAPDAVAVRFPATTEPVLRNELTYRELDEESSRLARHLIAHGTGPGDFVAVAITRSVESVLAVWAVAKTGATYVPIDPTYPADRIAFMVADSGVTLGITVSAHRTALATTGTAWIELDDPSHRDRIAARPAHPVCYQDRLRPLTPGHIAYVIFTSGSTGRPKEVTVTHEGLAGLVEHEVSRHKVTRESRVTHLCSPSFDVSVLEMLLAFSAGATLVVVPPAIFGGAELTDLLHREQVTHLCVTPSVLESLDPTVPNDLKSVICAGERVGSELVARWAHVDRSVHNLYGPTEATIIATGSDALVPGDQVHIGTAVPAMGTYILDAHLRPVPDGVIGELYLTGPALALGYLHRPALTAERFLANPFPTDKSGTRMYRTGDLVRRTPAGTLEYHDRADSQVKVRGLRIELDEIDNTLTAHPDIDYALTLGTTLPTGTPRHSSPTYCPAWNTPGRAATTGYRRTPRGGPKAGGCSRIPPHSRTSWPKPCPRP